MEGGGQLWIHLSLSTFALMSGIDQVARPVWQSLYLLSYFAGAQLLLLSLVLCDPVIFHDSVPTPIVLIVS